ncbi:hypothetical protein IQ270_03620 [Microcoleus sp. LEGE 07076]|uniref:hypothetical protein n=1 Tax=Microcoleus sp. LEGE 07076 TaxID=915322 RepID=UPI001881D893|nr:hypothetical protein [Microcoleus sp. LEGE 07076]MBE9183836.1 hypothetical protein [Microcoleus sp. LEGE 07076]
MFYKERVQVIKRLGLVIAGISAIPFGIASLHGFLTPPAEATALNQPASSSLPHSRSFQIAQVEGCPKAEMVESFATANFSVYICKTQEGAIFYRGLSKRNGSQINVMQVTTSDDGTYEATNGNIIYSINPDRLQVRQNGKLILTEAVIK